MAYATLAQLREFKRIKTASENDDDLMERLLDAATRWIEGPAGAGRVFKVDTDTTRYFSADAITKRVLWLDKDLAALVSITNGDSVTVPTNQVRTIPRNEAPYNRIELLPTSAYSWNTTNDGEVAVTGKWGYSLTPPDDIVQVTLRLAGWYYDQMKTSQEGDRPLVTGDGFMVMPTRIPHDVGATAWAYRRSPL